MKKILSILLFIPCLVFSQKYFLLDDLKKDFKVETYTLNTSELYDIKKNIIMYNVFVTKDDILLLSVLPDLDEKVLPGKDERGTNWILLDKDKLMKEDIISTSKIKEMVSDWMTSNTPEKKSLKFKLLKKESGNYYVSKLCLTEFFSITALKYPLVSSYGTLNTVEQKVSIKEVDKSFKEQFPDRKFIMDVTDADYLRNFSDPFSFKNYLSKEYMIKGNKAYQFWTFDGWWFRDGYNVHRGIDRLVYLQGKGIVGGSYDFYFKFQPAFASGERFSISNNQLWNNMINEKVMMAEELK